MEFFANTVADEGTEVEAVNAYCFGDSEFFVVIEAVNDNNGKRGSALLRVPMDAPEKFTILDEFDRRATNYWAHSAEKHFVQASGRHLRHLDNGSLTLHSFASFNTSLMHMAGTSHGDVVLYGDDGMALLFTDANFVALTTGLTKNLHSMDIGRNGIAAVGGNFGAFATGELTDLVPTDLGFGSRITLLNVRNDASISMAVDGDLTRELRDGEITQFDEHGADWCAVTSYDGDEFWGDDEFGVFVLRGSEFIPVFETEYAFNLNAHSNFLVVNSAFAVRIFDGSNWRNFEIRRDPIRPIAETELDFESNWPV